MNKQKKRAQWQQPEHPKEKHTTHTKRHTGNDQGNRTADKEKMKTKQKEKENTPCQEPMGHYPASSSSSSSSVTTPAAATARSSSLSFYDFSAFTQLVEMRIKTRWPPPPRRSLQSIEWSHFIYYLLTRGILFESRDFIYWFQSFYLLTWVILFIDSGHSIY